MAEEKQTATGGVAPTGTVAKLDETEVFRVNANYARLNKAGKKIALALIKQWIAEEEAEL